MANRRDLHVGLDADDRGFAAAFEDATEEARGLDRQLAKLERQQAAEEKVTASSALAMRTFAKAEDKAALSARKMGLEVKRAAEQAEKAEVRALAAAEAASKGMFDKERASKLAARADDAVERAAIKAAEAQLIAAHAAEQQAEEEKKVARAAELAAAAQRLAAYKATGSVKEHNAALRSLEARFGNLSKEGKGAFTAIEASGSKTFAAIGSTGYGTIALVAAAIMALPFAALGAEAAIAGGIGGALAGVGLMATKSDATVQAALGKMTSHVKSETTKMAAPFKSTWLAIAQEGTRTFDALAPEIGKDFAKLAPVITGFVHDAGYAVTLLGPSFGVATDAASKLIAALGGKLPEISRSVGRAIEIMAKSAGDNADEFANIASAIAGTLPFLAHLIDYAIKLGPVLSPLFAIMAHGAMSVSALHDGLANVSLGLISTDHSLQIAGGSFPSFTQKATMSAAAAGQLMTSEQAAALSADQLKTSLDALTGKTLTQREAMYEYRKAIDEMTQSLKANGREHGFNSAKGAENEHNLDKLAQSAQAAAEAMKAAGKDPAPFLEQARQKIIAMAERMHYSAGEAKALADKLLGIKAPPPIVLSLDDQEFMAKLHNAQGLKIDPKTGLLKGDGSDYLNKWLTAKGLKIDPKTGLFKGNGSDYYNKWLAANHLHVDTKTGRIVGNTSSFWASVHAIPSVVGHRTITVTYNTQGSGKITTPAQNRAEGGLIGYAHGGQVAQRMASGGGPSGPVVGPGSGTSDDIPVWLSNGEYVIRAGQTKKHKALLDSINNGKDGFAAGGVVGYATGGTVADVGLSSILSDWSTAVKPSTKAQVDAAVRGRRTQVNQLASAEDALAKARRKGSARDIAAAERRITAERQDLAAATAKLNDVESRYKFTAQKPATQLASALGGTIKNTAAFIKNLTTLTDKGFGVLAQNLLAMGGTDAEKIAADAVKLSSSKLSGLQKQVQQTGQQQTSLANLGGILTVKTAMQGGANTWDTLLSATGLAPNDLAASLKLMTADLQKTGAGQALLAMMKAHGYARGGPISGPPGVDNVPLWGTAGEYMVRKEPAAANRSMLDAINTGRPIQIPAGMVRGGDGAASGRPIVIQVYARDSQSALATAKETAHELGWEMKKGGN